MLLVDQKFRRASMRLVATIAAVLLLTVPALSTSKVVLVFGDSLVAGLGLSESDGFVAQMQAALSAANVDITLVNGGVSGDTSATSLDRLDWALGDKPDAVLLELGANDMLQGLPVDGIRTNLDAIMKKLEDRKLPVFIAGMKANRALGNDYVKAFDALYPQLAAKYGAALYPFFLEGVAADSRLNQADLIHPNAAGVKTIVGNMLPSLIAWARGLYENP